MKRALARALLAAALVGLSGAAVAGDPNEAGEGRVVKRTYKFEWKSPFADMSPQGMAIVGEAMKRERIPANTEEVRRARQRVLGLLEAEKLDIGAIRKAQAEERALAIKEHALAQEKMLRAYQQLSIDDRRAFAAGMRMQEERMLQHMDRARARMKRMEEQIHREMERVKKETGNLWIVVPPAAPVVPAPVKPVDGRG